MATIWYQLQWNQVHQTKLYILGPDLMDKYQGAAQVVELTAFLGWLQIMDVFSLEGEDITIIHPF